MHYIDVGQADAELIKIGNHAMLIDGGNPDDSDLIYTYLKNQEIDYLDYIICTHDDADHVGGLPGAFAYAGENIGTVLAPYEGSSKERFQIFAEKLSAVGKSITVPHAGDKFKLGGATFQILSSGEDGEESVSPHP